MPAFILQTPSSSSEEDLITKLQPKEVTIDDRTDSEEHESSSSSSEEEIEYTRPSFNIPPEYWHIQKLVKFLKTGNQAATTVALCCLRDHDLTHEVHQFAVQDCGGIEVLVNLLETKELDCKLGTLSLLVEMAQNETIRKCLVDLGCVPLLVKNLLEPATDLKIFVGEVMYHLGFVPKARKDVRHYDGIQLFVDLLMVEDKILRTPMKYLTAEEQETVRLAKSAARALWSLSKSKKNMHIMMRSGCVALMAKLLGCVHTEVMIPTLGALSQCVVLPPFQMAVCTERMVDDIVKNLYEGNASVQRYCCETIFYAAEGQETRDMIRQAGGLQPLVSIISDPNNRADKDLLAAATGAIWKTAITPQNVVIFDKLQAINVLVKLLESADEDERVLSNVVGALCEFLRFSHNRDVLRRSGGIPYMVNLLNYTYPPLLENLPMVLRECAEDEDSMRIMEDVDGVRLIWSLLKNKSLQVQANAAWCLVPCIRNAQDSGEMVRSFVGGLEIIVQLLRSDDVRVLGCVCAAIAEVAKDIENLAVITDHGVVPRLVDLITTDDVFLREHLCSAIAFCCAWGSNCKMFGRLGAITPLVGYMADNNEKVNRTAAIALYHMSENPFNCITMHESGVVIFLLRSVTSEDHVLQEAAAGCLANIRKLALEAETTHLIRKKESSSEEDYD
ncbi:armadillo repeat-containing protein gudu-like [Harmonia axyridis]|uniref:armadillo repeat-containing protein gudu-like n=1 Tax=Harmonia axyridis TaxID=115357 RepID=UPI001E277ED2|nr:armadillo repeat-containing protein gudu-like [Harmonia axyridis]